MFGHRVGFWEPALACGCGVCQAGVLSLWLVWDWGGGKHGQRSISRGAAVPWLALHQPSAVVLQETAPGRELPWAGTWFVCTALDLVFTFPLEIFQQQFRRWDGPGAISCQELLGHHLLEGKRVWEYGLAPLHRTCH